MAVWEFSNFFRKSGLDTSAKGDIMQVTRKDLAQSESLSSFPHGKGNCLAQGRTGDGIPDRAAFEVSFGTKTRQRE